MRHVVKTYRELGGKAAHILNVGTEGRIVSFMRQPLPEKQVSEVGD
jgi:hypothetical protein